MRMVRSLRNLTAIISVLKTSEISLLCIHTKVVVYVLFHVKSWKIEMTLYRYWQHLFSICFSIFYLRRNIQVYRLTIGPPGLLRTMERITAIKLGKNSKTNVPLWLEMCARGRGDYFSLKSFFGRAIIAKEGPVGAYRATTENGPTLGRSLTPPTFSAHGYSTVPKRDTHVHKTADSIKLIFFSSNLETL